VVKITITKKRRKKVMTTYEILENLIHLKKEVEKTKTHDEEAISEVTQLISGSLVLPLYGKLWENFTDMDAITEHLEALYDDDNHFGLIYFVLLLAGAVDYTLPKEYFIICANDACIPIISSAIISDWLDYDAINEVEEIEI
jgi:hypothetical protein